MPRYVYKKVMYDLTRSNLITRKIEQSMGELYGIIEEQAMEGWRFVQMIHPYSTNSLCMLVFEKRQEVEA